MRFKLIGSISSVEPIATGKSIRDLQLLRKLYGTGRWKKLKGCGTVSLPDGTICEADLHWYEAHGLGKK